MQFLKDGVQTVDFLIKITRNAFCVEFVGRNFFFLIYKCTIYQFTVCNSPIKGGRWTYRGN